jgi:hypothetical protein
MSCPQSLIVLTNVSCRYLPAIGRFLIVVTFLEDALRIITQWSDQLLYLHDYRHSMAHLDRRRTKLIELLCSSIRSYPSLPNRKRRRYGLLLHPGYCAKILGLCCWWPHWGCYHTSPWIWTYLRSQLLSPQPVRDGWSVDGSL